MGGFNLTEIPIIPNVVDDGSLDAYVARLDEAQKKKGRPPGQPPAMGEPFIIPASEMANLEAARENVDEVVAEGEEKLEKLDADVETTKTKLLDVEGTYLHLGGDQGIKGLERSAARITRMLPGLSEAYRFHRSLFWLKEGSVFGAFTLLLLAWSIYKKVAGMLEEQKRQQEQFKKEIMEIREFTTSAEFQRWQENQRRLIEGYRTGRFP